jgi:hypothetical protein
MDGVLVNFNSGVNKLDEKTKTEYHPRYDNIDGIFSTMDPISGE